MQLITRSMIYIEKSPNLQLNVPKNCIVPFKKTKKTPENRTILKRVDGIFCIPCCYFYFLSVNHKQHNDKQNIIRYIRKLFKVWHFTLIFLHINKKCMKYLLYKYKRQPCFMTLHCNVYFVNKSFGIHYFCFVRIFLSYFIQ